MDKLEQLNARLAEIDATLDKLLEADGLTEEQKQEHDRLVEERAGVAEAVDREESRLARETDRKGREERAAKLKAEQGRRDEEERDRNAREDRERKNADERRRREAKFGHGSLTDRDPPSPRDVPAERPQAGARTGEGYTVPAAVRRTKALSNFRGTRGGVAAEVRAYRFGMFMMAKLASDMPGRFRHLNGAVEWVERHMAASRSNDSTGTQYLIPPEFSDDIIDLRERYGVARRLFKMEPMTSDTKSVPRRKGGLTAYFVTEATAGTESNKIWDNVMYVAKDVMVLSRYTNQVNADAVINFGDDLAGEIAYAFSQKEDDCAFNGDGTSTYGGITGVRSRLSNCDGAGTASAGLVTAGTTGSWAAIALVDFQNVAGKLPQFADSQDAAWVTHRTFYYSIMQKLELAAGGVTALEVAQGDRKARPLFLGYPVEFSQIFPATTGATQVVASLGDYRLGCGFGDRQMDEIAFSEHATIGGENVFERNQIGIRGTERIDINVHDAGTASVVGPIVGLTT